MVKKLQKKTIHSWYLNIIQLDYINVLKVLRDFNMMAYLNKLFLQWIVSGEKECLCMSVLQEGNGNSS